jgi:hypothetical protein
MAHQMSAMGRKQSLMQDAGGGRKGEIRLPYGGSGLKSENRSTSRLWSSWAVTNGSQSNDLKEFPRTQKQLRPPLGGPLWDMGRRMGCKATQDKYTLISISYASIWRREWDSNPRKV